MASLDHDYHDDHDHDNDNDDDHDDHNDHDQDHDDHDHDHADDVERMKAPGEPRQSEEVQRARKTLPETPENQFDLI